MKRPFQRKEKPKKIENKADPPKKVETSLTDSDYQRRKLFKKGVNFMADEKL